MNAKWGGDARHPRHDVDRLELHLEPGILDRRRNYRGGFVHTARLQRQRLQQPSNIGTIPAGDLHACFDSKDDFLITADSSRAQTTFLTTRRMASRPRNMRSRFSHAQSLLGQRLSGKSPTTEGTGGPATSVGQHRRRGAGDGFSRRHHRDLRRRNILPNCQRRNAKLRRFAGLRPRCVGLCRKLRYGTGHESTVYLRIEQEINGTTNADLLPYFNPTDDSAHDNFTTFPIQDDGTVDAVIQAISPPQNDGASNSQLGRLSGILNSVAGLLPARRTASTIPNTTPTRTPAQPPRSTATASSTPNAPDTTRITFSAFLPA